jgi:quercetin dioxygenase-like cupin family protein
MMKFYSHLSLCLFLIFAGSSTYAQHNHDATDSSMQLQFAPVLNTFLSDPDLKKFQLQSSLMIVSPSLVDTVSHRHDADLFGYVIEGTVEVGLDHKDPTIFKAGQMFHEKRNVIHSLLRNPDKNIPAKVLLIFIIKEGRQGYTKLYPEK